MKGFRQHWYQVASRVRTGLQRFVWVSGVVVSLGVSCVSAQDVRINFRDADIRSVIESVAEVTGKSFVLDPRVKGEVTIIAPQAISSDLLYEAVLSALQVQGFQALDDGAIIRIVPFSQSFNTPTETMGSELATRVISVNNVRATELLPVLKPIMSKGSLMQAFDVGNHLVVTDTISQLERLEDLLLDLDSPEQSAVDVIQLQNISAGEALYIANQMQYFQQQSLNIVEDSLNNRVIVGGPRIARDAFRRMLVSLDVETNNAGGVEVVYLNYSDATEIKTLLDGMLQSPTFLRLAGDGAENSNSYTVEVDEDNNALVIAASSSVVNQVKQVIERLDRPRRQVLIEAVIAEVSEDQSANLTAQLLYASRNNGAYLTQFNDLLVSLLGAGLDVVSDDDLSTTTLSSVSGNLSNGATFGGGDFDSETGQGFGVLVEALRSDSETRILSTPSIVTLNNEEAELSVGQEVPFVTGSYTSSTDSSSNPFQTIEREEVGIMLRVTPQINESNAVRLQIEQESSDLLNSSAQAALSTADVVTSKRTISTNVMIGHGEVLVLGGLVSQSEGGSESKVPLLGDIPIIGNLFKSTSDSNEQRVLMMFIRPTILSTPADAYNASSRQFDYLKNYQVNGQEEVIELPVNILSDYFEESQTTTDAQ